MKKTMTWETIDTAPKDGTPVLIYAKDLLHGFTNGCAVARWTLDSANDARFPWWRIDDGKFGPYDLRGPSPTHWMKLPDPPDANPEGRACTCSPNCPQPCKGKCGCEACMAEYSDFLSTE